MAKQKISEYSQTASNNTDLNGISCAEGMAPSDVNNWMRELMSQVKDFQVGAEGDPLTVAGTFVAQGRADIGGALNVTGATALTGTLTAAAGIVANITGNVTGTAANVTGTVAVANGGTGLTTLTANNLLAGNGTGTVNLIAASTSGNVLTSDGTAWTSSPIPIATDAEAIAGTNNTNFITPLRMREGFNASGDAPVYACRAWVNFNGEGTVAIRASGNVSSITDNGTGDYQINLTTAMPDANYSISALCNRDGTGSAFDVSLHRFTSRSSSRFDLLVHGTGGSSGADSPEVVASVFR